MKIIALVYMLSLDLLVCSCQCSNQDFKEYEGEYYGKIEKREVKKEKEHTSPLSSNLKGKSLEFETIGLPKMSDDIQELRIKKIAYILSYNKTTLIPNWVAWHLTGEHTDGDCPRDNAYYEDESVPFPRATNEDYHESGWSRGHMCPAGDNKWDAEAMRESNLLTNICPQHASLNSGLWNVIERDCRKWARKYGDLYIVCGPVLLNKEHETIGANKVVVPEAFFKVILRMNPQPTAIGFIIRNNEGKKKKGQFINTVDEVERITGIDFFPSLPDSVEDKVEAYSNINDWR